jgi:hypothetical protein
LAYRSAGAAATDLGLSKLGLFGKKRRDLDFGVATDPSVQPLGSFGKKPGRLLAASAGAAFL